MKHNRKILLCLASSALLFSIFNGVSLNLDKEKLVDEISYKDPHAKDYKHPDFVSVSAEDEEDEDEEIGEVNKVIIHYVNDDNNCKTRAFYIWANGVDGQEYSDEYNAGVVDYAADGSSMSITVDYETDRFSEIKDVKATSLMFIIKYKMVSASNLNWGGQSEDVELSFRDFPPTDGLVEAWCTPAAGGGIALFHSEAETKVDGVKLATFDDWKTISCTLTPAANEVEWSLYAFDETYYRVKSKNRPAIKKNYLVTQGKTRNMYFEINLKYNAHINVVYSIVSKDTSSTTGLEKTIFVSCENLYGTSRFEQFYNYKGNDLGMTYSSDETTFKVWSPVAANMSVLIYDVDTPIAFAKEEDVATAERYTGYHMFYQPGGIWTITLKGDLKGKYYTYQVDNWNGTAITMDPYATGCGACGVRGLIYDKADTNPENWSMLPVRWDGNKNFDISTPQELTVYEVHIQDFTGDKSWVSNENNANGTFNAFVERGTRYTQGTTTVKTGFDHLEELGVNAVQLMPVFDADNDEVNNKKYNWGYNPLNYNCVEGVYSSDPHDGVVRIKEYKNLVYQLATIGTRVIMDVVYNHVSSPSASCFNKLMPRYFFRYDDAGELYDGSGCHNEFKSEATMARKYIVDSTSMWAKEYKIKGFRFDLMGLIDTHTMLEVKKALYKIDPDIYLYGEGWTAGGFHGGKDFEPIDGTGNELFPLWSQGTFCCNGNGNQVYSSLYSEENECILGGFNDLGRNAIKGGNDQGWGSPSHLPGWGFISQGSSDASENNRIALQNLIWGAHGNKDVTIGLNPKQTVNYASCHDNWTLRDQLYYTLGNPGSGTPANGYDIMHASETVHALIFASNGVSFMLGGEELLRTKDLSFIESNEVRDAVLPNTYEDMYGHKISHNSYNSPLEVNSFKWGNKISTKIDNETINTSELTPMFAKMIKLHKEMPKYDILKLYGPTYNNGYNKMTSAGNLVDNLSWNNNGSEVTIGIQFDEYFIFVTGREHGTMKNPDVANWGEPLLTAGLASYDSSHQNLELGGDYGTGYGLLVYRRGN